MEGTDLTGAILDGRYRVIEPISEGAMGVVYRAERLKLGRIVAIKVLHDELPSELSSRKRFEIEAMAMAKLEHPHCAAVIDVGVHDDKPFVVMDFVSGQNLRDILETSPVPRQRAVEIMRQVLAGLAHAHEHGIIHRDIKPANIVLSQKAGLGDHVKILDFGLARFDNATSNLTTGIVVGTPSYMAPEQIRGVLIDHRADLYACGVLLFELLTGKKPFSSASDDPVEVCSLHLKKPPPTLEEAQPGLALDDLEPIVAKALSKKPDDRYATAVEFAAALELVPSRASAPVAAPIAPPIVTVSETGWAVPADARSSMYPADAVPSAPTSAPASSPVGAYAPVEPSAQHAAPQAYPGSQPYAAAPSGPQAYPSQPYIDPACAAPSGPPASKLPPPFRSATPHGGSPVAQHAAPIAASTVPPSSPVVHAAPIANLATPHSGSPIAPQPHGGSPIAAQAAPTAPSTVPPSSPVVAAAPITPLSVEVPTPPVEKRGLPTDFDLSVVIPQPQVAIPDSDASTALPEQSAPVETPAPSHQGTMLGIATVGQATPRSSTSTAQSGGDTVPSGPPPPADTIPSGPPPAAEAPRDSKATVAFLGAVPAGPSPLAARDAPAVVEPATAPTPRPARPPLTRRQLAIGVGVALGVILLIALIVGTRGGESSAAKTPPAIDAGAAPPPKDDPESKLADEHVAKANDLLSSGRTQAALDHILATRKVFPRDARFAYLAGKIYFERQWWSVGLKQFRDVLSLDPSYRTNDELIKIVLKAFITPADYPSDLGSFLRNEIGEPARAYLQETAASHPRAGTRARAKAELDRMR